jgi:MATE family multidrug resistance protein
VAFIGRLSEEKMAIAVLATSFMSVTGFSVVLGLLGALDTLAGQAWGAKNYKALGITLQKAVSGGKRGRSGREHVG